MSFVPPSHAGPTLTAFALLGLFGLVWGLVSLGMLWRARAFTKLQAHDDALLLERAKWPLSPGPSRVIHGTVEALGEAVAIEIDIVQKVANYTNKNIKSHDWTETSRRATTHPFQLVRDDGRTVRVEPNDDVLVIEPLEKSYPDDRPMERVRSAVVRSGDEIYVCGDLFDAAPASAYRGGATFVLRPPRRGRLIVATEMLRDRYRTRIRSLRGFGIASLIVFAILHLSFTMPIVALMFGTHETATITDMRQWTTRSKNAFVPHYEITATAKDGARVYGEVEHETYASARYDMEVPIRRAGTWTCLGDDPTVHLAVLPFATVLMFLLGALAGAHYKGQAPWYDQAKLVEPGGAEHWSETRLTSGRGRPIDPGAD